MRFQVPQFIEVEDKIFGQLTFKQFIYLAGGGGLSFLVFVVIGSIFWSAIPIIIIMAIAATFAFYKVNGKHFIDIAEAAFKYYVGSKLYIWKKVDKPQKATQDADAKSAKNYASVMVPKISDSKLKDLTWSLDIQESIYTKQSQK